MSEFDERLEMALDYMRSAIDMIAILKNSDVLIDASGLFRLRTKNGQWIVTDVGTGEHTECDLIKAVALCKNIMQWHRVKDIAVLGIKKNAE